MPHTIDETLGLAIPWINDGDPECTAEKSRGVELKHSAWAFLNNDNRAQKLHLKSNADSNQKDKLDEDHGDAEGS